MGAKYLPSVKDLQAIQRFQEKQKRARLAAKRAPGPMPHETKQPGAAPASPQRPSEGSTGR